MTKEKELWGCPDWRDENAYPESGESLEDWQWKWQFLRRLPDYRNAWNIFAPGELDGEGMRFPTSNTNNEKIILDFLCTGIFVAPGTCLYSFK